MGVSLSEPHLEPITAPAASVTFQMSTTMCMHETHVKCLSEVKGYNCSPAIHDFTCTRQKRQKESCLQHILNAHPSVPIYVCLLPLAQAHPMRPCITLV